MRLKLHRILLLLLVILPVSVAAEEGGMKATLDSLELGDGLFLLRSDSPIGNPSTLALRGEEGFLLVDPNLLLAAQPLKAFLRSAGDLPVRYIATTHFHGDHSEGLEVFPDAVSFAPVRQRERLATGEVVLGERPIEAAALPDIVFDEDVTLRFAGRTIDLLLPPNRNGHTDGDLFVYLREDRVLVAGDYVFFDKFPIVDLQNGGSLDGFLENLRWVVERFPPDTRVVPGHGTFKPEAIRLATIADVRAYADTLEQTVEWIRGELERGADVETLATREDLPEPLPTMGARPRYLSAERWIRQVHRALTPKDPA